MNGILTVALVLLWLITSLVVYTGWAKKNAQATVYCISWLVAAYGLKFSHNVPKTWMNMDSNFFLIWLVFLRFIAFWMKIFKNPISKVFQYDSPPPPQVARIGRFRWYWCQCIALTFRCSLQHKFSKSVVYSNSYSKNGNSTKKMPNFACNYNNQPPAALSTARKRSG